MYKRTIATCLIFLFTLSIPAMAHHGTAISYDASRRITLEGVVTEFRFANPHAQLYFDVKDEKGNVVHWAAEGESPRRYVAAGWTMKRSSALLMPGTRIKISLDPSRAGTPAGYIFELVTGKGEPVLTARRGEDPLP